MITDLILYPDNINDKRAKILYKEFKHVWSECPNKEEANLHKEDFAMKELTYLVFLYCEGRYVTSIQANEE